MSVIKAWFGRNKAANLKPSRDKVRDAEGIRNLATLGGAHAKTNADDILMRMEWRVLRRLDGVLHGNYRSLMRGFGMDLADLREYQADDDVRFIDWNVTARMDSPYVRQFQEDRDVCAWFLLDLSASMRFGSSSTSKLQTATQTAAVIARLLTRHGNPVAALMYSQAKNTDIDLTLTPRHGRLQVLRLIDQIQLCASAANAVDQATTVTNLSRLLESGRQQIKRRSLVFVISDFVAESGWEVPLSLLAQRHEVTAIRISDPLERELPNVGGVNLQDAETGEQIWLDTSDKGLRQRFAQLAQVREERFSKAMTRAGVDSVHIGTDGDLAHELIQFSAVRKLRKRRA